MNSIRAEDHLADVPAADVLALVPVRVPEAAEQDAAKRTPWVLRKSKSYK